MSKLKCTLASLILLSIGVAIGGYLFSRSQPRSFLSINRCQDCWTPKDFAGLIASVGINKLSGVIPYVVFETEKTIVIKSPFRAMAIPDGDPEGESIDYVIFPKKDIKNIG